MLDCIKENRYGFADKSVGVISPTYNWRLPSIVKEFLEKITVTADYLYFIAAYGTTTGAAWTVYKSECKNIGNTFNA